MPFKKNIALKAMVVCTATTAILATKIEIINREDSEGLFLLRGDNGKWLAITDDLYPFESYRLMWSVRWPDHKRAKHSNGACTNDTTPCTYYEWNEKSGRGFIKTSYPSGEKFIVSLGRFTSSNGNQVSGLFVGGGLPVTDPDYKEGNNNELGMNYYDGTRFYHIWCNVNEGIQDGTGKGIIPSTWQFVSSKVLEASERNLTINSKHRTTVNTVPISIERTLFYTTGDKYLTLYTTLKNTGTTPTVLSYVYGDEPWLGNYYTFSKGNIGWYKDGLLMTESVVDTSKNTYIGLFDYGNPLAGESHSFSNKANFLEWSPASRPEIAYVSNIFGSTAPPESKVPLNSYKNRVVALQWGPMVLAPGKTFTFALNVGLANNDPKTGMPVMPKTTPLLNFR